MTTLPEEPPFTVEEWDSISHGSITWGASVSEVDPIPVEVLNYLLAFTEWLRGS